MNLPDFYSDNGKTCQHCEGTCYHYRLEPDTRSIIARCIGCRTYSEFVVNALAMPSTAADTSAAHRSAEVCTEI